MKNKSKQIALGRTLVKSRFQKKKHGSNNQSTMHTTDLPDSYGYLNVQSVTEESSFQDFLSTAQLAGTEFQAEKLNVKFLSLASEVEQQKKAEQMSKTQEENREFLQIPRRPTWNRSMSASELHNKEREEFLEWRRKLALLQENENLIMTPYEKNLEFWRQLWRVIEYSDVIVQIVDARNPLLFRCEDLEKYVKEVDSDKVTVLLINKADFLTDRQRQIWAKYFSEINVKAVFFSAIVAMIKEEDIENQLENVNLINEAESEDEETETASEKVRQLENENLTNEAESGNGTEIANEEENYFSDRTSENVNISKVQEQDNTKTTDAEGASQVPEQDSINEIEYPTPSVLNRQELIAFFKTLCPPKSNAKGILTIGLVGYPNVGKSSTINALMLEKKVSVSTTPGKTKHFQTLFVDEDLILCDCPGLVMPSFVNTRAEMLLNGILPINQMRDHVQPTDLIGKIIPRHVIEDLYGIMIPLPLEGEDPDRPPKSEEILNAHGLNRGFMTQNGQPDNSRSARYILKDFVSGKLLYCVSPPNHEQKDFHTFPERQRIKLVHQDLPGTSKKSIRASGNPFANDPGFNENQSGVHFKGTNLLQRSMAPGKAPRKKEKKSKKKEKSRRVYVHLDKH